MPDLYRVIDYEDGCRFEALGLTTSAAETKRGFLRLFYSLNPKALRGYFSVQLHDYGGVKIRADRKHNYYDQNGNILGQRHEIYASARYHADGPYAGHRVMLFELGDPHEHGVTRTYVEIVG